MIYSAKDSQTLGGVYFWAKMDYTLANDKNR